MLCSVLEVGSRAKILSDLKQLVVAFIIINIIVVKLLVSKQ